MSNRTQVIADRLRERRVAAGFTTQKAAAEELGMTRSRYKNFEIALRTPDYDIIEMIGNVFNTSPAYLCGWTNDPTPLH